MVDYARLELDRMLIRQNRILSLRDKYEKCRNEQVKNCLKRQIENLEKLQKQSLTLKK